MTDAESGLVDWSLLSTSAIRRVEALRGPGATFYGDSAIGGVIQILTDRGASGGRFTSSAGQFATFTGDGMYGLHARNLGVSFTGAADRSDGPSTHSGRSRIAGGVGLDATVGSRIWRLSVTGGGSRANDPGPRTDVALRANRFGSDPLFALDHLRRRNALATFSLSTGGAWQSALRLQVAKRNDHVVRTILLAPEYADRRARALSSFVTSVGAETGRLMMIAGRPMTVRVGFDLSRDQIETDYHSVAASGSEGVEVATASGHRWRSGAFGSYIWEPSARVRLSTGLRWDHITDRFTNVSGRPLSHSAWSPRLGLTLRVKEGTSLFAQMMRAFKAPTPDQLFDPRPYPGFVGGTFMISNSMLKPQRATNIEVGASGGKWLRWSALAYRMAVKDEIDFDLATFSYGNIGESRHVGVEAEATLLVLSHVRPSVNYALIHATPANSPQQLKNIPRHVLRVAANVDLFAGYQADMRFRRSEGAYLDDENVFPLHGASTVDLRIRRSLKRWSIFVDVLNIAGSQYQTYGFTLTDFRGRVIPYSYPGSPRATRFGVTGTL